MSDAHPWVHYFGDPLPDDDAVTLLGGKGASLHRMTRAGLAVPPGFTITTACSKRYFELGRRWPEGLEDEVRRNLARLERETGRELGRGELPLLVSVRSGAARSMPGMMETILDCGLHPGLVQDVGDTPEFWRRYIEFVKAFARSARGIDAGAFASNVGDGELPDRAAAERFLRAYELRTGVPFPATPWEVLVAAIDAVFDSWESERAVAYRRRHGIRDLGGTAVNIQEMFPSEVSGVIFTVDPTAPETRRIVIEASHGLGESVVSGEVVPDRFLIERSDLSRVECRIGSKVGAVYSLGTRRALDPEAPSLSPEECRVLSELALEVERFFDHPVDVEWARANGRIALLQARRIRGLDVAERLESVRLEEIARLEAACAGAHRVWVIHNLAETLRFPTPLTWDIVRGFMRGDGGFGRLYTDLGYRPSRRVREEGFLELAFGRIFQDPERLAELFWDGLPLSYDMRRIVARDDVLGKAPERFDPERADARFLLQLAANLWSMARVSRRIARGRRDARRRFESALSDYLKTIHRERERELEDLTEQELLDLLGTRTEHVLHRFGPESLRPGFFAGLAFGRLETLLSQLLGPAAGGELASTLTSFLEDDITLEQDALLHQVARGTASLEDFLERFGHRALGEMELRVPRWREDPRYLLRTLARWRKRETESRTELRERRQTRRVEAERELPALLARSGGSSLREEIEVRLNEARELLPYRERGKHYLMMGYELIRRTLEELTRRWDLGDGIYFLRLEELPRFEGDRSRLLDSIDERRLRWECFQRLDVPDIIDSSALGALGLPREIETDDALTATAIASGTATGTACVVLDPAGAGDLAPDAILVCPSTDPAWTPLFAEIRGLVVERGGVLSHGAIVARDFGIPAVVSPGATRNIRTGDRIRIDGTGGRVVVLERGT